MLKSSSLAQIAKQLDRFLVERDAFGRQIVRAHDRRVARGVAAGEIALLEHGDLADAVMLGEVVGRRQTVAAAADDDDVVGVAGLGRAGK